MEKQKLLNVDVNNLNLAETIHAVERLIEKGTPSYLVEVNVDVAVKAEKDPVLKRIITEANLVLVDGKPLIWASKLQKRPVKEKISGSDLVPVLLGEAEKKGYTVYLLGGKEEVLWKATENIRRSYPSLRIAGTCSPQYGFEKSEEELKKINCQIQEAAPDILFAFLGCPKQEKWIYENYREYQAKLSLCAGATVDFLAGAVKRAPKWMSNCGLEWFFRFCMEPRRLFKRYFIDDMKFFGLLWKYR